MVASTKTMKAMKMAMKIATVMKRGKRVTPMKAKQKATKSEMKSSMKRPKTAMKKSSIAKGPHMRRSVYFGHKTKTYSGLQQSDLRKNKLGRIVSKQRSESSRRAYVGSKAQKWLRAVQTAKKQLNLTGFVLLNGPTPEGKALYAKSKANYTMATA
eukprot:TRINITY_DN50722_c0_g1_i1.p1 TRINITY_DN50722_c0_g1~~TRINITY_DN50722_c0_g1_i1.p1  ORF type:complete len:182 (-),score=33.75 TRINITY_DN50722_c0_g1_i1:251-718(-)